MEFQVRGSRLQLVTAAVLGNLRSNIARYSPTNQQQEFIANQRIAVSIASLRRTSQALLGREHGNLWGRAAERTSHYLLDFLRLATCVNEHSAFLRTWHAVPVFLAWHLDRSPDLELECTVDRKSSVICTEYSGRLHTTVSFPQSLGLHIAQGCFEV